ncbi:hypothetical protein J4Q44_G00270970 [Coregonus suidteri]|uniref:Uncharacterized protein n=1 Tax=Coregonus suidteri TaxID=861788 RepID=A0AAN8L5J9_9TELE
MGLLSDPNRRRALTNLLTCLNAPICVVCYLVGVAWFMGLACEPFTLRTYMSENAMGSTMVEERHRQGVCCSKDNSRWVVGCRWIGWCIPCSLEGWKCLLKLPFPMKTKRDMRTVHGTNVYGILRAPRAPRTEALVLSAPCSEGNNNNQAVGLLLDLAQYFRSQIHWAKDIIFLVDEHDLIGMQARGIPSHQHHWGEVALSLELSSDVITSLDLIVYLCTIQGKLQRNDWDSTSGYSHAAQTMMLMVLKQASGRPWGDHGLFLRYHIEAATVRGINSFRQYKTDTTTIGR